MTILIILIKESKSDRGIGLHSRRARSVNWRKKNIETITDFNQPNVIKAIKQVQGVTEEPKINKISENSIQTQINKVLEETEQKKKEKEQLIKLIIVFDNLDNSLASEIIKRLNKLNMEYSIIEALLKEILSRLSNKI